MEHIVSYFISVAAGVTVGVFWEPLWLGISGVAQQLFSNLPSISGQWKAKFEQPNGSGASEEMSETVSLKQMGRLVRGNGTVADAPNRRFIYRGSIVRNTLRGTYWIEGMKSPAGTGTFQVRIAGNDAEMMGWCTWYDFDTDKVEASSYKWKKDPS